VVAFDPSISAQLHAPLVALVDRQWGVVSRRQLLARGVAHGTITAWLASGRLRPLHRGVFAYGHARLRAEGRWMAAVLACEPGAALSHRSAAAILDLLPYAGATIHVTTLRALRRRPGIHPHRARSLDAPDVTRVSGITTTTIARTALDLAATEPPHRVERFLAQADRQERYDQRALEDVVARHNGHPGTGALTTLTATEPQLTRSDLEGLILEATRARGLTLVTDHPIHLPRSGEITVDYYVPAARLVIEADSWKHHRSRASFEADRLRDLELTLLGYRTARLTSRGAREALDLVERLLA
jgi:very-short-patch-repair endonuclease